MWKLKGKVLITGWKFMSALEKMRETSNMAANKKCSEFMFLSKKTFIEI